MVPALPAPGSLNSRLSAPFILISTVWAQSGAIGELGPILGSIQVPVPEPPPALRSLSPTVGTFLSFVPQGEKSESLPLLGDGSSY